MQEEDSYEMGQWSKKIWFLILAMWIGYAGLFPNTIARAADVPFNQGKGYEIGAYDQDAAQPTAMNWARQSSYMSRAHYEKKWSYETGDMLESSPAIGADGAIYVGSNDGKLYALDPHAAVEADRVKWSYDTGDWIVSSPAIGADGTIYVGSYDGKLYALNPHAADDADRLKWCYDTGDWIASSPAIGADGTIYVGSYDGKLYALDSNAVSDDKLLKWSFDLGDWIVSSPAIDKDGIIYVGSYDGKLYALDSYAAGEADRLKWFYDTGLVIESSPAIGADGTIYVGSYDGKLYALDPHPASEADRLKWFYETGNAIVSSPALGLDGTIYFGSSDGKLYALNPHAASDADRVKWSYQTEDGIRSSPIIGADGMIYVGSYDGKLYALDPRAADESERVHWFYQMEGGVRSSPAIDADGTIYVGSLDHTLYALGAISLAIPDDVIATVGEGTVHLEWKWVDKAARYQVYLYQGFTAPDEPANWVSAHEETVTDTVHTVKNLTAGMPYWFTIKAVSFGGNESDYSEPVFAIPYATITGVEPVNLIQVGKGIAIQHLPFPETVRVQLSTAAEVDLDVEWDVIHTDYDPGLAGVYTVIGQVLLPEYIRHPHPLQIEIRVEVMKDTNAKLSEIYLNGNPLDGFTPEWFSYSVRVPFAVEQVTVAAATYDPNAIYEVVGGNPRDLAVGSNSIKIIVTSEDEGHQSEYMIRIEREADREAPWWPTGSKLQVSEVAQTRVTIAWPEAIDNDDDWGYGGRNLSGNAELQSLELWASDGSQIPFDFSPEQLHYNLETDSSHVELRVSAAHTAAKVTWNKKTVNGKKEVALLEGVNIIELIVHAEDGTEKMYTVTIDRKTKSSNEPEKQQIRFDDIAGHWAEQLIQHAATKGITNGFPDGTFKPDQLITRAQFTVMLVDILHLKNGDTELTFTDTDQIGEWAKEAVAQTVQAGIVSGYEDGSFRPNATITRAELAVMIARVLGMQTDTDATTAFVDDEAIPRWAKGAVNALHAKGIVNGRGGNKFVPNDTANRAEAVVVLLRVLERSSS